jgi:DNA modification methylase
MIKLINDNCLNVLKTIDFDNSIIVSDPPFNIGYHYKTYKDKLKTGEYNNILMEVFNDRASVIIHYPEDLHRYSILRGEAPEEVVSWVYPSNTGKQHRDIAFYGVKPNFRQSGQDYKNPNDKRVKKLIEQGKRARLYDWWEINQVKNVSKEKTAHPCQMPLKVMERIIEILPKDKIIVDPFLGSGTTGLACKGLGRDFIGIELDEDYFNISKNRIGI